MFDIDIQSKLPSEIDIDKAIHAIGDEDFDELSKICKVDITIRLSGNSISRAEVGVPDLLLSFCQLTISLSEDEASGQVYCHNEPFLFIEKDNDIVKIYGYDHKGMIDRDLRSFIEVDRDVALLSFAKTSSKLANIMKTYSGGAMVRPNEELWGVMSAMVNNPFQ